LTTRQEEEAQVTLIIRFIHALVNPDPSLAVCPFVPINQCCGLALLIRILIRCLGHKNEMKNVHHVGNSRCKLAFTGRNMLMALLIQRDIEFFFFKPGGTLIQA
jgi:hypothetical protein